MEGRSKKAHHTSPAGSRAGWEALPCSPPFLAVSCSEESDAASPMQRVIRCLGKPCLACGVTKQRVRDVPKARAAGETQRVGSARVLPWFHTDPAA